MCCWDLSAETSLKKGILNPSQLFIYLFFKVESERERKKKYHHRSRYASVSPEKGQILSSTTSISLFWGGTMFPGHPGECLENQACSFSLPLYLWPPTTQVGTLSATDPTFQNQLQWLLLGVRTTANHPVFSLPPPKLPHLVLKCDLIFWHIDPANPSEQGSYLVLFHVPHRTQCPVHSGHPLNVNLWGQSQLLLFPWENKAMRLKIILVYPLNVHSWKNN